MSAFRRILFWVVVAAAAFHAAYAWADASFLIVLYLFALVQLAAGSERRQVAGLDPPNRLSRQHAGAPSWRQAFYSGLAVGLLIAVVRLAFFWRVFSGGAVALWVVYAFWIGLFVALARMCLGRLGPRRGWLLIPFIWTGLEYFRSELYYLRFSWLTVGYAFAGAPWRGALKLAGTYGLGFLLTSVAAAAAFLWRKSRTQSLALLCLGAGGLCLGGFLCGKASPPPPAATIRVAGVQMEFPSENEVRLRLHDLIRAYPDTKLVVLSEYTFDGPVPAAIRKWCRQHGCYLIAGGKDPAPGGNFYNTAFVVGPGGDIVFRQVKAVPIQFFKDGLPAPEQKVWNSPWGKIGICICYDLSYTRVTDRLVELGAEAVIVPTMDVVDWGRAQHELHARIAPVRATEYGLPLFRVASSGISQLVDRSGRVVATAPCPGDAATIAGALEMRGAGRRPLDRWLAPFAAGVTAALTGWWLVWCLGKPSPIGAASRRNHKT